MNDWWWVWLVLLVIIAGYMISTAGDEPTCIPQQMECQDPGVYNP